MPIGGFVITVVPELAGTAVESIRRFECLEVHGHDEHGNVVAVLDCETSDEMEDTVRLIEKTDGVLSVGLAYFNAEDEIKKMANGKYIPSRSFGNRQPGSE